MNIDLRKISDLTPKVGVGSRIDNTNAGAANSGGEKPRVKLHLPEDGKVTGYTVVSNPGGALTVAPGAGSRIENPANPPAREAAEALAVAPKKLSVEGVLPSADKDRKAPVVVSQPPDLDKPSLDVARGLYRVKDHNNDGIQSAHRADTGKALVLAALTTLLGGTANEAYHQMNPPLEPAHPAVVTAVPASPSLVDFSANLFAERDKSFEKVELKSGEGLTQVLERLRPQELIAAGFVKDGKAFISPNDKRIAPLILEMKLMTALDAGGNLKQNTNPNFLEGGSAGHAYIPKGDKFEELLAALKKTGA